MFKKIFYLIACLGLLFSTLCFGEVRILTFHYNKPEFIELQHKTFQKFMKDDYQLIVFNDAKDPLVVAAIQSMCDKYGILCVRYEQEWHKDHPLNAQISEWLIQRDWFNNRTCSHLNFISTIPADIGTQPSIRHSHVIQYALDHFGYQHDGIVCIVDGDAFLTRPLSIKKMLSKRHIIGIKRDIWHEGVDYFWVPFIAINMPKIANKEDLQFHADVINDKLHDTGAHSYHFLQKNPLIKFEKYSGYSSTGFNKWTEKEVRDFGFSKTEVKLIKTLPWPESVEFHMEKCILHYGGSSFNLPGSDVKTTFVLDFINAILE